LKELNHLAEIFEKYDTFVIDLWGVVHNGVTLNPNAIEAVDQLKKLNDLYKAGALTKSEFTKAKKKLLD